MELEEEWKQRGRWEARVGLIGEEGGQLVCKINEKCFLIKILKREKWVGLKSS